MIDKMRRIVRAVSVQQPWANMIAAGKKTIETRTWCTRYRGELLIVSCRLPPIRPAGFAVALCKLADCRRMCPYDEAAACVAWSSWLYAWVLEDVRAIEPFEVKGRLGFFKVEVTEEQLAAKPKKEFWR